MKILLILFSLLMLSNSCDSSKKAIERNNIVVEQLSGTYAITQLEGGNVSSNALILKFDVTSNTINGFAGCNSFFGSYTRQKNMITFNNIAASKKYCSKEIMTLEATILKSLNSVTSFSITDNIISFLANDTILIKGSKTIIATKKSALVNYEDNTAVKYKALSRVSFDFILISKSRILISKDDHLQDVDTYQIEAKDWKTLSKLIEAIDATIINGLKPPSTKHQFDGAPHATLAIIKGDVEYITPTFDHGNPPQEIEALVNKVLSIKENTIK